MTPMQLAFYYMFCLLTGVIAGWGVAAYARRRRQKAKSCSVSIDYVLIASSALRKAWAGADPPGSSPRTMVEMEALLAGRKPHKPSYETPMYRPDLGVIPGGRIAESHSFAERVELAAARKASRDVSEVTAYMSARQMTLWDLIPAPADLQKPAVG